MFTLLTIDYSSEEVKIRLHSCAVLKKNTKWFPWQISPFSGSYLSPSSTSPSSTSSSSSPSSSLLFFFLVSDEETIREWRDIRVGSEWFLEGWAYNRVRILIDILRTTVLQSANSALHRACVEVSIPSRSSSNHDVRHDYFPHHSFSWWIWHISIWGRSFRCYLLGIFAERFLLCFSSSYNIQ